MQMACHLRSISLPTRPHSLVLKVEEELQKLRDCVASPSLTAEMICSAFEGIRNLYDCIEELCCLPSIRNGLSHPQQKKLVEEELDRSVKLLDLCDKMRDNLDAMKTNVQDLRSALRRGAYAALESKLQSYIRSVKKGRKDIEKMVVSKCAPLSSSKEDCDLFIVVRLFTEAREIAVALLQSVLSFLCHQIVKQRSSKWTLVSKAFNKRKVSCEEAQKDGAFAFASYSCNDLDDGSASRVQKHLQTLEWNINSLENGVDCLFRRLIQTRVSLLNILSS
ncbi:uncharacterized protein LOC109703679 [Ananas comosus]|uniref:Uncharacterized protein LOC109703679 n=1 Tax=Ananas comosus TaxID=4615 RepID=A0A6P5EEA4_ANACO|nr:uncharacterized protein LOC109703679 [Ananas comosus]